MAAWMVSVTAAMWVFSRAVVSVDVMVGLTVALTVCGKAEMMVAKRVEMLDLLCENRHDQTHLRRCRLE